MDLDGGDREEVSVPAVCCAALSAFFFCVTHMAAVSVLSIDTVQELPGADVYPSLESRNLASSQHSLSATILPPGSGSTMVNRLALFASSSLFTKAIETAAQRYTELLQAPMTSSTTTYDGSSFSASEEDVALQACFDLLVCEALSTRLSSALTMLNSASSTPGMPFEFSLYILHFANFPPLVLFSDHWFVTYRECTRAKSYLIKALEDYSGWLEGTFGPYQCIHSPSLVEYRRSTICRYQPSSSSMPGHGTRVASGSFASWCRRQRISHFWGFPFVTTLSLCLVTITDEYTCHVSGYPK